MWYDCRDQYGNDQMIYLPGKDIFLYSDQTYLLFQSGANKEYATFSDTDSAKNAFENLREYLMKQDKIVFSDHTP